MTALHENAAGIDWEAAHAGLAAAQRAAEKGFAPSPEEQDEILKARARALSREAVESNGANGWMDAVVFTMAHERYAVAHEYVREVYPLQELTPIPCTPPFILGVVNIRGQIMPLTDLKKFFGLPEKGLSDVNRVVVLHAPGVEIAIIADLVIGMRQFDPRKLQSELPTISGIGREYLRGVAADGTIVLETAALLRDARLIVNDEEEP